MKKDMTINQEERYFVKSLKQIVHSSRGMAYAAINYANVRANWLIGQRIVEQMQKGENRAEYGTYLIKLASEVLTKEFGKGFSETNIKSFRKFYLTFSNLDICSMVLNESKQIGQTVSAQSQKHIQQTLSAEFNDSVSRTSSNI
ncbi:MAG: hypothetical protein J6Y47_06225 [Bacteroidales bacterium]|nr:hypothetical protein [Bacteroidales bacterium]